MIDPVFPVNEYTRIANIEFGNDTKILNLDIRNLQKKQKISQIEH